MQIILGQMVARFYGGVGHPTIGMIVGKIIDTWIVEWYDGKDAVQIRYQDDTVRGYVNAYNRLREKLCKAQ